MEFANGPVSMAGIFNKEKTMATRTKNKSPRKKPMLGSRIQQLCPAPPNWRVLMLFMDEDDKVFVDVDADPQYFMEDIAAWALVVDESKTARFQQIWPCVAEASGVIEAVCPAEAPGYVGIVPPSYEDEQIEEMVQDMFESMGEIETTILDDDEDDGASEDADEDDTAGSEDSNE